MSDKRYTLGGIRFVEDTPLIAELDADLQNETVIIKVGPYEGQILWIQKQGAMLCYEATGIDVRPPLTREITYKGPETLKYLLLDQFFALSAETEEV